MIKVREFRIMMFTKYPIIVGQDCFLKEVLNMYYLDFIRNYSTTKNQFPIAIKTHIKKYNYICDIQSTNYTLDETLEGKSDGKSAGKFALAHVKDKNLSCVGYGYKIIPWNSVKFQNPIHGQLQYQTCAETTTLNIMMYLLYNKVAREITSENIKKYNELYPNNKVKAFFNEDLIKQESIPLTLELKLSDFCLNLNELANIKYLKFDKFELSGDINNFIATILVVSGIDISVSSIEANKSLFIKLFNDFEKNEIKININSIIIDDLIKLSSNSTHIEMNLNIVLNYKVFDDLNLLQVNYRKLIEGVEYDYSIAATIFKTYIKYNSPKLKTLLLDEDDPSNILHLRKSILEGKTLLFSELDGMTATRNYTDIKLFHQTKFFNINYNLMIILGKDNFFGNDVFYLSYVDNSNVFGLSLVNSVNINIVANQLNNIRYLNLSSTFNGKIDETALQNCKVFVIEGLINNPTISKKLLESVEILIIRENAKIIDKILTDDSYLEQGCFPNAKLISVQHDDEELVKRIYRKVANNKGIYCKKDINNYVQVLGIDETDALKIDDTEAAYMKCYDIIKYFL
jgi:hypothetical protein